MPTIIPITTYGAGRPTAYALPGPRSDPEASPFDPEVLDALVRRRAVELAGDRRGSRQVVLQVVDLPERRQRAREPTNPFPTAFSAPFLTQALAQGPPLSGTAEAARKDAEGRAAYAQAAATVEARRFSIFGPEEPLRLAA